MTAPALTPAEIAALRREDARYLLLPLDTQSGPRSMAAHLRQAVRQLRDDADLTPSASAAARLLALQGLTTPPHPAIVCAKGCHFCCSQPVTVTAPEVFLIANAIRHDAALVAAVLAGAGAACPLLVDQACGVYGVRPMACRAFVSASLPACLSTFVDGRPVDIPMPVAHTHTLFAVRMLLMAALRLADLDDATFPLAPALVVALREPDAEARWRAGQPVFAAVPANPPIPAAADAQIRQMVEHVRGTV